MTSAIPSGPVLIVPFVSSVGKRAKVKIEEKHPHALWAPLKFNNATVIHQLWWSSDIVPTSWFSLKPSGTNWLDDSQWLKLLQTYISPPQKGCFSFTAVSDSNAWRPSCCTFSCASSISGAVQNRHQTLKIWGFNHLLSFIEPRVTSWAAPLKGCGQDRTD